MPFEKLAHQCRLPSAYYTWWGRPIAPGSEWRCPRCGTLYKLVLFEYAGVRSWVAQRG